MPNGSMFYHTSDGKSGVIGWFPDDMAGIVAFIIALPFLFLAVFLQAAANYISEHSVLVSIIYFAILFLIATLVYYTSKSKFKLVGIPATVMNFIPLYLYIRGEIPYIITIEEMGELVGYSISWLIVTIIILAISIFLTAMGMLTKNGIWHMVISIATVILGIFLFV